MQNIWLRKELGYLKILTKDSLSEDYWMWWRMAWNEAGEIQGKLQCGYAGKGKIFILRAMKITEVFRSMIWVGLSVAWESWYDIVHSGMDIVLLGTGQVHSQWRFWIRYYIIQFGTQKTVWSLKYLWSCQNIHVYIHESLYEEGTVIKEAG